MLFVSSTPLTAQRAAEVIRGLTPDQFEETIAQLNRSYREQGRPYLIRQHEGGKVLMLRPRYRFVVEKLYGGPKEARLSQAAVEVLSIVAYRQPVTRADIESLRGKDSAAPLRQLVRLGLVEVVGRAEGSGSAVRYGTTPRFLELFGLSRLEDLPESDDLSRL
jgi:segregation and condensation protein B